MYSMKHILHDANFVADALAKHGLSLDGDCRIFNFSPNFIHFPILVDVASISFPCLSLME